MRKVLALVRASWLAAASYRLRSVMSLISLLVVVVPIYYISNAIQPIIVYLTIAIGTAVLSEAALSFLQVGPKDPTPAWGLMLVRNRKDFVTAPWTMLFPMFSIVSVVLSFSFVADGVRDALDPKLR